MPPPRLVPVTLTRTPLQRCGWEELSQWPFHTEDERKSCSPSQ